MIRYSLRTKKIKCVNTGNRCELQVKILGVWRVIVTLNIITLGVCVCNWHVAFACMSACFRVRADICEPRENALKLRTYGRAPL